MIGKIIWGTKLWQAACLICLSSLPHTTSIMLVLPGTEACEAFERTIDAVLMVVEADGAGSSCGLASGARSR